MRIGIAHGVTREAKILAGVIAARPGYEVAWVATTGEEAVERASSDPADVLLIDLMLPGMKGAETTRIIMKQRPCAILIVTPKATEDAARVFEAMGNGALDVVSVPSADEKDRVRDRDRDRLLRKITTVEKLIRKEGGAAVGPVRSGSRAPMVAIGSSTGGPKALAAVLSGLPERFGAPVVIVQHLDVQFAGGLADWLGEQTKLKVVLAREGMHPVRDTVYVAGTNDHLVLGPDCALHYVSDPKEYPYRPSVDRFFLSARDWWSEKGVAVLLTGMGRDGAKGLLALREAGWHTIAQDEATSVVYGMPKAAAELGAAHEILEVERVAESVVAQIRSREGIFVYEHGR